jgi:hypothetical protein
MGGAQQAQLVHRVGAAADENNRTAGDIDEDREKPHFRILGIKRRKNIYLQAAKSQQQE